MAKDTVGVFEAIDSFAILTRNEFYIIGRLKEGYIPENGYAQIVLNSSLSFAYQINSAEQIIRSDDIKGPVTFDVNNPNNSELSVEDIKSSYTLLTISGEKVEILELLSLNIGSEDILLSLTGPDW